MPVHVVTPADRPDAPRHHEARDRGAAEPVAGGADVAVRAAEQRPPLVQETAARPVDAVAARLG